MAASPTPRVAEPESRHCIAVAYSGGRDSTALLHVTARQAQALGLRVVALHVHHGLSTQADAWVQHCRRQCELWLGEGLPVTLQWQRLAGAPAPAQSVEAWAREGRYAALAEMARGAGADLLLLAQHRRDQAETLLLQALRGAGVAGLAAMPAQQWRDGLLWARPWLRQPREAIETYLQDQGLDYIDDDSNGDARYARNRLRLNVWPALSHAFPGAESSLAQAAGWVQQALALQQEVAGADLALLNDERGLDMAGVLALSPARASNALRAWLLVRLGQPAPASLVRRLLQESGSGLGNWPCPGGCLTLYRHRLRLLAVMHETGPTVELALNQPGLYPVPAWQGAWHVRPVARGGITPPQLAQVVMRPRTGGEQFQRHAAGPPRSLKKCFQSAALPTWQRRAPLLFSGEHLLFVPGLGLDARRLASADEPQLGLDWLPDADAGL
jgi:tRNA(Ile)-lysidine synthase